MTLPVSIDSVLVKPSDATISVYDEGLLRGDGVFEMIRVYRGHPFALSDHLDRLRHSGESIGLEHDRHTVERDIGALLAAAQGADCSLRIVLTRGGRRILILEPVKKYPPLASVLPVTFEPSPILAGVKSLSYAANMHASRIAHARGYDEALLVTKGGVVLEAPTASVYWARGGRLFTPALDTGILESITRRRLMERLDIDEGSFPLGDLENADEAFLASSVREVQGVDKLGDRTFDLAPGPLTKLAHATLQEIVQEETA